MSDDIVARLRTIDMVNCMDSDHLFDGLLVDAADEIERLRAELRSYTGDKHTTREPFEPTEPFTPEAL